MNAALAKASELELETLERHALNLEWAEGRLAFGDREGALAILPAEADVQSPLPLSLLRTLLFAQAERIGGQANRAAERLSTTLIKLPQPLDPAVSVFVGGRDWTASQVATVMSEWVAEAGPEAPLNVWRRLALLGPQDAQAQIVAARGLLLSGEEEAAKAAWRRAEALDSKETKAVAARDPRLKPLQSPRRP